MANPYVSKDKTSLLTIEMKYYMFAKTQLLSLNFFVVICYFLNTRFLEIDQTPMNTTLNLQVLRCF